MIKLIIKLAIAVLIINAAWRLGSVYLTHYKFKDSVQQEALFRGNRSDEALKRRIFDLAAESDIPLTEGHLTLHTLEHHTIVDGDYTRVIELAPGFKYSWSFTFHVDTLYDTL